MKGSFIFLPMSMVVSAAATAAAPKVAQRVETPSRCQCALYSRTGYSHTYLVSYLSFVRTFPVQWASRSMLIIEADVSPYLG
jgi:hypothetical protein